MSRPCLVCGQVTSGSRCSAHQRPRPAHKAAYNDGAYRAARRAMRGQRCHICGLPGSDTVDHLVPLAVDPTGGGPSNWAPAHRSCNSRKG